MAQKILGRLQREIEEILGPNFSLSTSVVSYPGSAITKETLLFLAEDSLARAKASTSQKLLPGVQQQPASPQKRETLGNVLIVDDDPIQSELFSTLFIDNDYTVFQAENGKKALQVVVREDIDLVLLDIMMPDLDGYEVCSVLKHTEATRIIPVILLTCMDSSASKVKGIECGADDFITKPPIFDELLARVRSLIETKKINSNLTSIENILTSLANIIEKKDSYTEGHIRRVANMAMEIGKRFGMQKKELETLKLGGILHDIGKIGIPGQILNKPAPLTTDEWEIMKKHVQTGYNICLPMQKNLGPALEIIRHHHERLDGSGYPDGLSGDQISLEVRIMAVVDTYDALTTRRSYRKEMSKIQAFKIVEQESCEGRLDPKVVEQLKYFLIRQEKINSKDL